MVKKEIKTCCSLIADHYFNKTDFMEYYRGQISGSYLVITEIENLCKNGTRKVSREELIQIITTAHPTRKDLKDRIKRVIRFAKNPKEKAPKSLLDEEDGIITIKLA